MLDFAFRFWKAKLKRKIVKAKTHNRKSKNSKLQQRRGEIEIISPFCVLTFSCFWLSLIRVFLFASSQSGGWPSGQGAWTLKPRCRHRCEILLYSHFYPCRKLGGGGGGYVQWYSHFSGGKNGYIVNFPGRKWLGGKTTIGHRLSL